jgi:aspartate/methionine/tyrosine aminotransferase
MLLAKTELPDGWIDMGIGEAYCVRNSLLSNFKQLKRFSPTKITDLSYFPTEGNSLLVRELFHSFGKGRYPVIVGAGAKQILFCAFMAYKEMGYKRIVTHTPYWSSFPRMAELAGLEFSTSLRDFDGTFLNNKEDVLLIVSPNNPDGDTFSSSQLNFYIESGFRVIHDAAYESDVYNIHALECLMPDIKVYSAAKQWGLSGLRLGWGVFNHSDLMARTNELVEATTSGTSILSQSMVYDVLRLKHYNPVTYNNFVCQAMDEIIGNRKAFLDNLSTDVFDEYSIAAAKNSDGMFVFLGLNPGINFYDAKVRAIDGAAFGMPGWFRFNVAVNRADCLRAAQRISELK